MITAEEARNNDQLYFSNSYKTALSLYLKPEDNYSELIDLIDRSVGKQSCVGKYTVVVTLIAGGQKSVRKSIDISKAIDFLKNNGYSVTVSGSVDNDIVDFIVIKKYIKDFSKELNKKLEAFINY